jgi:hypothetical protein
LKRASFNEVQDVDEVTLDDRIIFPTKKVEMLNDALIELSNKNFNVEVMLVGIRPKVENFSFSREKLLSETLA